jgi:hypothetical protein
MSRPTAAYVGFGLSHPIRLVIPRKLHGDVAKLVTPAEALELIADLSSAVARALADEAQKNPSPPRAA